jgi:hypothetical protein
MWTMANAKLRVPTNARMTAEKLKFPLFSFRGVLMAKLFRNRANLDSKLMAMAVFNGTNKFLGTARPAKEPLVCLVSRQLLQWQFRLTARNICRLGLNRRNHPTYPHTYRDAIFHSWECGSEN